MIRHFSIVFVLLLVVLTTSAQAQGWYAGAGIGNTFYSSKFSLDEAADQVQEIDENSTSWKIFGGFRHEGFLGIEGGYRNFGSPKTTIDGEEYKISVKGWDANLIGRVEISLVDIFAKAGWMWWNGDGSYAGLGTSDSGSDFIWGLGAGVRLGRFGVRLEWESLEVDGPDNLSMVSLSGTIGF